jgi:hypothetical protein
MYQAALQEEQYGYFAHHHSLSLQTAKLSTESIKQDFARIILLRVQEPFHCLEYH